MFLLEAREVGVRYGGIQAVADGKLAARVVGRRTRGVGCPLELLAGA